jgi:hypothetical protein
VKQLAHKMTVLLGLLSMLVIAPAWATPAMIWSQSDAPFINVYYSPDGVRIQQITSAGINISPNLFHTENSTWLTWVDKTNREANQLKYARLSANGAVLETGTLPTINRGVLAPAISIDATGQRVWLVWVEHNGRREILYASYRDIGKYGSGAWKPALQITPDDQYSSNLPIIEEAYYDRVKLSWMRTSTSSTESAGVEIMAHDWAQQASMRSSSNIAAVQQAPRRPLTLKNAQGYDTFINLVKKGRPMSSSAQDWSNVVRNRNALMGATHSGSGASTRLVVEIK